MWYKLPSQGRYTRSSSMGAFGRVLLNNINSFSSNPSAWEINLLLLLLRRQSIHFGRISGLIFNFFDESLVADQGHKNERDE